VVFQDSSHRADDALVDRLQNSSPVPVRALGSRVAVPLQEEVTEPQGVSPPATGPAERRMGTDVMHDFLIALAFIGMVIAPAIVAASTNPEATDDNK
jgi:hypothetical protein